MCLQILAAVKALYTPITNALYPYMLKGVQYDVIKRINRIMFLPISVGSAIIILIPDMLLTVIGGSKYISAQNILRLLLPAFIFSYYSMLYGWPVLGALGKVKETTLSTVFAAMIQLFSIAVLILCGTFNLYTLAISFNIAEVSLFGIRFVYFRNLKLK